MTVDEMITEKRTDLYSLCARVRDCCLKGKADNCKQMIFSAMKQYPHAPEPHNLIGIVLEKEGDHVTAMKHFRAAWALDPTYLPARKNLDNFGTFFSNGKSAYDESDCRDENAQKYSILGDALSLEHPLRRI